MSNNGTALVAHNNQPSTIVAAPSLADTKEIARIFFASRIVKSIESEAQACAKILAGQELGIGPMASLSQIHLVEGKATMDATLVGAMIKKSGRYDYRLRQADDTACRIEFFERGESVGVSSFTIEQAKRAGLAGKNVWKSYPEAMLRSRAMTQGARMYCPDVFNGAVYDPSELGAEVVVDDQGSMKVVSVDAPREQPSEQVEAANVQRTNASRSRSYADAIRRIYAALGVDAKSKDSGAHAFAIETVANAIAKSPVPSKWSEFSVEELEKFLTLEQTTIEHDADTLSSEHCEICSRPDDDHREGCPNG